MDASQYKDYILTLLFVKYVTDKFKGVKYADITVPEGGSFDDLVALKGNKNIGEEMDKVIAKLAEAGENNLRGVIDNAHFNDEAKLGSGKEMVDKLTGLIAIFQRDEFNFKKNKASGDDILGDAYEYLMRHFATESGKSKGQFYTPAEVSRILAKVIGIDSIEERDEGYSVYDPACGSGSLLIRAADEAPFEIAIWGQEKEVTTAGLAKMNLVLHNKAAGEIRAGNTFSAPRYFEEGSDDEVLKRFDFAVANPPFSLKNWTDGLKDYGRFDGYGDRPPEKNGDFAWLLHILKSLKSTGKAAVILPHGVLFRGNAEATIRKAIIDKGYIKGIIGLPANLFYGTGIPACIIIIDKADAAERKGIFMIDASHDFVKDGNKNRLRERDIYKIVTTFNQQITDDPKYARFVPNDEIKKKNEYNLNIPRYIDSSTPEDLQDIDAHLHGGIPAADVDSIHNKLVAAGSLCNLLHFGIACLRFAHTDIVTHRVVKQIIILRWTCHEDAHEAIVDRELWETVQEKNRAVKQQVANHAAPLPALFTGKLVCADCGHPLVATRETQRRKNGTSKRYVSYICSHFVTTGHSACSWHRIYEISLKMLVLNEIRTHSQAVAQDENAMLDKLRQKIFSESTAKQEDSRLEISRLLRRIGDLEHMTAKLYEDKVSGIINNDTFAVLIQKSEQERIQKTERLEVLLTEERKAQQEVENIRQWADIIRRYLDVQELDREIVEELIDHIEIGERSVIDGQRHQDIKIFYRFVGVV